MSHRVPARLAALSWLSCRRSHARAAAAPVTSPWPAGAPLPGQAGPGRGRAGAPGGARVRQGPAVGAVLLLPRRGILDVVLPPPLRAPGVRPHCPGWPPGAASAWQTSCGAPQARWPGLWRVVSWSGCCMRPQLQEAEHHQRVECTGACSAAHMQWCGQFAGTGLQLLAEMQTASAGG